MDPKKRYRWGVAATQSPCIAILGAGAVGKRSAPRFASWRTCREIPWTQRPWRKAQLCLLNMWKALTGQDGGKVPGAKEAKHFPSEGYFKTCAESTWSHKMLWSAICIKCTAERKEMLLNWVKIHCGTKLLNVWVTGTMLVLGNNFTSGKYMSNVNF